MENNKYIVDRRNNEKFKIVSSKIYFQTLVGFHFFSMTTRASHHLTCTQHFELQFRSTILQKQLTIQNDDGGVI